MTVWWSGEEPTTEMNDAVAQWLAERPPAVRAVAERFNPWQVYRLRTTGQACRFVGCDVGARNCGEIMVDADRVTVRVNAQHPVLGPVLTGRQVFGIDPDDLEPWPDDVPFQPDGEVEVEILPVRFVGLDGAPANADQTEES